MMRQPSSFDFRYFLNHNRCPATIGLIIANLVTFVTFFFAQRDLWQSFVFHSPEAPIRPWSLLTYPLVNYSPLGVLLAGYMLWLFGGSLERAWGTRRFLQFFA